MPYILEVQRFGSIKYNGKFEHIGYMSKLFTTKKKLLITMIFIILT